MQKKLKKCIKRYKNNGITLIALVITIIILLILARNINIKFNRKWTISKSTKVNNNIRNKRDRRSCKNIIYGKANR
ncbi:MAG: hypothetical protein HFJ60_08625 [Clostridia bacterium]|jgi:hypothetical protein|nr:hypothetical protein [Clostridia bacterium]